MITPLIDGSNTMSSVENGSFFPARPGYSSACSENMPSNLKLAYGFYPGITAHIEELESLLAMDDEPLLSAIRKQQVMSFIARHYNDRDRRTTPIKPQEVQDLVRQAEGNWEVFYQSHALADPQKRSAYCERLRFGVMTEKRALSTWAAEVNPYPPAEYVVVANRGEVACRILEAAHALNKKVILLHDGNDLPYDGLLREGDFLYYVPCFKDTSRRGNIRYDIVGMHALAQALENDKIDLHTVAVHPGWGFNAEDPEWVAEVERLGFRVVGPHSQIIRYLGNKTNAVAFARAAGLDTPISSGKIVGRKGLPTGADPETEWNGVEILVRQFFHQCGEQGISLLILKDALGGGGAGQKLLTRPTVTELVEAVRQYWQTYIEFSVDQFLATTRHVEFQVVSDVMGNVRFGEPRDCTLQRARQKYNEETTGFPPALATAMQEKIRNFLVRVHQKLGWHYTGAATFEFLYDPESERFYFMEVNTRLQVENCVSACVDGIDYFRTQLDIADRKILLSQEELDRRRHEDRAHAIQARICLERILGEDERTALSRSLKHEVECIPVGGPGVFLTRLDVPAQQGVYLFGDDRLLWQIRRQGQAPIPMGYDSMAMKIVATGKTAEEARWKLHEAISQLVVEGPGIHSNRDLILLTLEHAHRGEARELARRKIADDALAILRAQKEWETLAARGTIRRHEFQILTLREGALTAEQWAFLETVLDGYNLKTFYPNRFKISCLWIGMLNPLWRKLNRYGISFVHPTIEVIIHERLVSFLSSLLRCMTGLDPQEIVLRKKSAGLLPRDLVSFSGWDQAKLRSYFRQATLSGL
ncbi:ATP-binding protein [Nitrospina gracilis]|uniref:ATP-binding protein n=1 Tax=Nitrospina gracilis TaxID=35801 RepID=UPI001F2FA4BC|nr:biotin carboxylase N-terminal domain-containing protein [Nitrospina gracilis]MCF8719472.1 biotin carboxylase [Nitrospina gracilis Nb-211]